MHAQGQIEADLRKFVADNFLYREGIDTLADTDSFLEAGLIDSTGVLELVCFLEKAFSIRVADEDVIPENLDSIRKISAYVQRKLWAAANPLPPLGVELPAAASVPAAVVAASALTEPARRSA